MIALCLATLLVGITLILYGGAFVSENDGVWKAGITATLGTIFILASIFLATQAYFMHEVNKYVNHPENYQVDTLMSNGQIKEIIVYKK